MATSVEKVEALAVISVVRWKRHFHCGQINLEDEPRSGRPSLAEEPGVVAQALILSNRIEATGHKFRISHGSVFSMIHDELHMTMVAARWVPRLLTPVQKQQWMDVAKKLLQLCQDEKVEFFDHLMMTDECWVYQYHERSTLCLSRTVTWLQDASKIYVKCHYQPP
jgi:hypothetical protein